MCVLYVWLKNVFFEKQYSHILEGQILSLRQDYINVHFPFSKARSWKFYIVDMLCCKTGPCDYNFIAIIEKHVPQYLTCTVLSHALLFLHMLAVYQVGVPHFSNGGSTFKSKMVLDILGNT